MEPTADFPDHLRDEYLLVRCRLGERDAFAELIDRFDGRVHAYLRRMAGSPAGVDDLRQDVWERVIRGIGRVRAADRLEHWILGIARRAAMDALRRRYRSPATEPIGDVTLNPSSWSAADDEALSQLRESLDGLPPDERDAVTLYYLFERSIAVVAELQSVPSGTVKSRLARARRRLAAHSRTSSGDTP